MIEGAEGRHPVAQNKFELKNRAEPVQPQTVKQAPTDGPLDAPNTGRFGSYSQPLAVNDGAPAARVAAGPAEPPAPVYWRTSAGVRLRSEPGTENAVVEYLPEGTLLSERPDAPQAGWTPVTSRDGRTGWVSSDYLEPVSPEEERQIDHDFQYDARQGQQALGIYIHQGDAEADVGMNQRNANCGPASLAMALRQQGLTLPEIDGIADNGTSGYEVQSARYAMYHGDESQQYRDGVSTADDGTLHFSENENSKLTGWSGLQAGVEAAQGEWQMLSPDEIATSVNSGKSVIVSGSFVDYDSEDEDDPWSGPDRGLWLSGEARHGATTHIVVITGTTSDGRYVVNDPINSAKGPVFVSATDLAAFMKDNAGAMSVGPRRLSPAEARQLVR
jgi:Bacterial SH3 domain/Peptidase_C39 like family